MSLFTTTSQGQVGAFARARCSHVRAARLADFEGFLFFRLGLSDRFNVPQFNTQVKKTACFDHLVQANVRNKKLLKDAVQNITAKGITNYTKGLEFAFEQLSVVKYHLPLFCTKSVCYCHFYMELWAGEF